MPRYRVEFALNLIVKAEDKQEAVEKADAYLAEHASTDLNPELVMLDAEDFDDDDVSSDIE